MKNLFTFFIFFIGLSNILAQPMTQDLTITKLTINSYEPAPSPTYPASVYLVDYTVEIKNIGKQTINKTNRDIYVMGFFSKNNSHLNGDGDGTTGGFGLFNETKKTQLLPNESVTVRYKCSGGQITGGVYFVVTADQDQQYPESNENNNQFAQLLPLKPVCTSTIFVKTKTTSVTADVIFEPVAGQSYKLSYRVKGSNTIWKEIIWNNPAAAHYFFINNLTPNTTYEYDLPCSYSDNGMTDLGKIKQFTTLPCADIKTVKAGISTLTQTTARVVGATRNGETYVLQYRPKGTSTWIMVTRTANSNSMTFDIANLKPATTYEYALRATCSGFYDFLQEFTTQGTVACLPPTTPLTINQSGPHDVQLSSSTSLSPLGYEIQYRIGGTTAWTTQMITPTTIPMLIGLSSKTPYDYHIRIKCSATTFSAYSPIWHFDLPN